MSLPRPIEHGGGLAAAARRHGGRVEDWLDLSTGINPNPVTLPEIPVSVWHRLPDHDLMERARVAARRHYRSGGLLPLPAPGTQALIQLLPRLVSETGARVAILAPTYGEYERSFRRAGLAVDLVAGIDEIRADHRLVVVVNPNNPTGRIVPRAALLDLAERLAARGGTLVVDEAFGDCDPSQSVADAVEHQPGLIVFRSFGKFFGLAGLRLGFVIAPDALMEQIREWLGPWAVSGPALHLAHELMQRDLSHLESGLRSRRAALQAVLAGAGLKVIGGTDLFQLVEDERATAVHAHLADAQILVRKFDYDGRWLRFGLAPNIAADSRLSDALQKFGK